MPKNQKVATRSILSAIVMLAGIITMAVGYYQLNKITLYIGLFITIVGVVTGIIFMLYSISVRQNQRHHI